MNDIDNKIQILDTLSEMTDGQDTGLLRATTVAALIRHACFTMEPEQLANEMFPHIVHFDVPKAEMFVKDVKLAEELSNSYESDSEYAADPDVTRSMTNLYALAFSLVTTDEAEATGILDNIPLLH